MRLERIDTSLARPAPRIFGRVRRRLAPSGWLRRLLQEPVAHFVLLGFGLFAVSHWRDVERHHYTIDVGPAVTADLSSKYRAQFGATPDPTSLEALRNAYIKREIYYREGVALGLDRDDEIVRRRIAQKYAFLTEEMDTPPAPSEAQLQAYFTGNARRYAEPARTMFEQVYFGREGETGRAPAAAALAARAAGRAVQGDEFPGPQSAGAMSQDEIERLFGRSDLSAAIPALPVGVWSGPYRSGYGWHIVRVVSRRPERPQTFAEAREAVLHDYEAEAEEAADAERYRRLLARYRLIGAGTRR
ncbi:MAG: peptidyl-prolyl cis-trans isomerase [Caulobacteraceae bacterium]|nr:peptidyl-prolyl cis-trans isomerase [Caulobacteraceae bacterium]